MMNNDVMQRSGIREKMMQEIGRASCRERV